MEEKEDWGNLSSNCAHRRLCSATDNEDMDSVPDNMTEKSSKYTEEEVRDYGQEVSELQKLIANDALPAPEQRKRLLHAWKGTDSVRAIKANETSVTCFDLIHDLSDAFTE